MLTYILLIASLFGRPATTAEDHPIHLSVMEIYESDEGAIEASITFFMDDFGNAVEYEKYRSDIEQGKMNVDDLIMKYLSQKMQIELNGQQVDYKLLRKQSNFPSLTCYLELTPQQTSLRSLRVENTMLLELFNDQRNMVHVRIPEKEGSMILDKKKTEVTAEF